MLLAGLRTEASAQRPGEFYRVPIRRVQIVSVDSLYVTYRVAYSEQSPGTVGRTYRSSIATWAANWSAEGDSVKVGILRWGAPVVWDSVKFGNNIRVTTTGAENFKACVYMYHGRLVRKLAGPECPDPR